MQIILLERIRKLGQMGDVVTVKDGFARNYLLPKGKALRATEANMKRFENERTQLETRNLELKSEAQAVAEKIDGKSFIIIRQASDTGQLYGSVSTRDIAELISEGGYSIERQQILLDRPIKVLGLHELTLSLHPEVESKVTVNVARTDDEADRQSRGEDVTAVGDEIEHHPEEEAISVEEVFEDETIAKEAEAKLHDDQSNTQTGDDKGTVDANESEEESGRSDDK